jgi:predicted alpha/beta-fold hydrolase
MAGTTPYAGPLWLAGGHLQTIVPALFGYKPALSLRRERWRTPDGDFIDLDWAGDVPGFPAPPATEATGAKAEKGATGLHAPPPLLVLFHGLEGNSDSHYARWAMSTAVARGWRAVIPHFRSCSGALNEAPRFYHSGDAVEIDWILARLQGESAPGTRLFVVGVSLGGNALLRWLGENPVLAPQRVRAAAAISSPVDLTAGGHALARGFNRVYTRHFLHTLKAKSQLKLQQFPGLFDRDAMLRADTLHRFDDIVTAPLHGFKDADDYWLRASAKPILPNITVPTLVLNARNDPFLPASALPTPAQVSDCVTLEQPATGGHVGFLGAGTRNSASADTQKGGAWLASRLLQFFDAHRER